jgi:predicted nucleic acid-binding protein
MTTVSNSRVFVDTNILCYANAAESEFGSTARTRLKELASEGNTFVISAQIIREYAHVTLRDVIYKKLDLQENIGIVSRNIARFIRDFEVVYEDETVLLNWLQFLPSLTTNKDVFDFNIAATLHSNNIQHILTHNSNDFSKFSGWLTILPLFKEQSKKQ